MTGTVSGDPSSPSSAVGPSRSSSLTTDKGNKDMKYDTARYSFFDKMKAKKAAAKSIVKSALPTMVEFACRPESNVGQSRHRKAR